MEASNIDVGNPFVMMSVYCSLHHDVHVLFASRNMTNAEVAKLDVLTDKVNIMHDMLGPPMMNRV
jgi:Cu/Ag efflux protein CusF